MAHSRGRDEIGEDAHSGDFLSSTISLSASGKICRVDIRDLPIYDINDVQKKIKTNPDQGKIQT